MIKLNFSGDKVTKKFILSLFNKSVDKEGYIIENSTGCRVLSSDGDEITVDDFGGITNGSEIYIRNNIVSLINFYQRYNCREN
jgi:hypothetical protein